MSHTNHSHLGRETIQALLDGRLSTGERASTEGHLAGCDRCRTRVHEWKALFLRLDALPRMAPGPGFAERVLADVRVRAPLLARVRRWLGLTGGAPVPTGHLEPELVLEYLDGALSRHARERAAAHLEVCGHCEQSVARWRTLLQGLESLERVGPSAGFADRVMARVQVPERTPAPEVGTAGLLERWAERLGELAPRSRRGWTVAAGAASAPVAALVAAGFALFSHPQLTPASLAAFLWWQAAGVASTLVTAVGDAFVESPVIFQLWTALQGAAASPLALGGGLAAFSVATVGAVWILYRHLIASPSADRTYANATA